MTPWRRRPTKFLASSLPLSTKSPKSKSSRKRTRARRRLNPHLSKKWFKSSALSSKKNSNQLMEWARLGNACLIKTLRTFRIWSMKLLTIHLEGFRLGHLRLVVTLIGHHIHLLSMALLQQQSKRYK